MDCTKLKDDGYNSNLTKEKVKTVLCDNVVKQTVLQPLRIPNQMKANFFQYISGTVYHPLGVEVEMKPDYYQLLEDYVFLDTKNSRIFNVFKKNDRKQIRNNIQKIYNKIADDSYDINSNSKEISKNTIELLQNFHVIWNINNSNN